MSRSNGSPPLARCACARLEATPLPLVVQDASGYVGNSTRVATQAALLDLAPDRVLFKPEAQPIGPNVSALLEATGGRAKIFEGTAGLVLMDSYPRGIVGTMPGADVPWAIVAIWRALKAGDTTRAGDIHARLAALVNLMHNLDACLAIEKLLLGATRSSMLSRCCCTPERRLFRKRPLTARFRVISMRWQSGFLR